MKKFMLFYAYAGCSDYGSLIFTAKNLNDAFAFAKRLCKVHGKTLLGVVDYCYISKYTLL